MKFKGQIGTELIPAHIANVQCPQHVIQFYEEHLSWQSDDDENVEQSKSSSKPNSSIREN